MRFEHKAISVALGGRHAATASTHVPAVAIRARAVGPQTQAGRRREITSIGIIDTGATMSMMPGWAANKLRLNLDEESKRRVLSVSDWFDAYQTVFGLEISNNGEWVEVGDINVVVPDTELSKDTVQRHPFLLGRGDFLEKFQMYMDESKREAWLRRRDDR